MSVEAKLMELGIQLPPPPPAVAAYEPWMRTGNLILTSGQLPWKNGELAFSGKCGAEITEDQGYQAARQCAINAISQLKAAAGDLDRVRQIVKVDGYVHTAPGFRGHPQVLNGASELIRSVFGERGRHARLAVGIDEMPLNAAVQICVPAEIEDYPIS